MQVAFDTAEDLSLAVDELFSEFPVLLYYRLNSVAPYPGFQSHNGIEMYFIEEGTGNYLAGNHVYPLQPGTLMIVRPYTLHKVLQTEVNRVICRNVLMWKEQFIRSTWPAEEEYPLDVMPIDGCRIQFPSAQIPRVKNLYESIQYELTHKQQGFEQIVHCLIKELLLLSYRKFNEGGNNELLPVESGLPNEISYLVQYIGSYFHEEITLDRLSQLVHMNSTYLCSLFHKYTGLTIGKFITVKRVHHAKKLLRETRLPVALIAQQSGFNDDSYFIRTFKKAESVTPAVYRRQYR